MKIGWELRKLEFTIGIMQSPHLEFLGQLLSHFKVNSFFLINKI